MDLIAVYQKVSEFFKNPSLETGILLFLLISIGLFYSWRHLFKEEILIQNQKKEIFIALVASGFNDKTLSFLKTAIELCIKNEPKKFYNYVFIHKKELSFFKEYPSIYKKVSANSLVFASRDLSQSQGVFGDIWYVGMHTSDLINDRVLANLDTALLMTNEGEKDLKAVNFYFDELITKSQTIVHFIQKLESSAEFKKLRKYMNSKF